MKIIHEEPLSKRGDGVGLWWRRSVDNFLRRIR